MIKFFNLNNKTMTNVVLTKLFSTDAKKKKN